MYYVYIIYSKNFDRFYFGQTNNIQSRLNQHNNGYSAATAPYIPWELKCCVNKETRSEAMILEKKLKNMNRVKILDFIGKYG